MPVKQGSILSLLKCVFIDVDCPDVEERPIERSVDPQMKELQESLKRVDEIEMKYVASTSSPKGGKGNSVVEKVEVDTQKAAEAAKEKVASKDETEKTR